MPPTKKNQDLAGKTAVITGGSKGIGLELAKLLVEAGAKVCIVGRNKKVLAHAEAELGEKVLAVACDVSRDKDVEALAAAVKKQFKKLDFLINNAGIANEIMNVEQLPPEVWRKTIDVNLTGTFLVSHYLLPLMGKGGVIVNNISVSAYLVFPGASAYQASKAGQLALTNTMRDELRERGIRVTALLPGPTDTEIWDQFLPQVPRNTMVRPRTVAEAIVNVLQLPEGTTVERLEISTQSGKIEV